LVFATVATALYQLGRREVGKGRTETWPEEDIVSTTCSSVAATASASMIAADADASCFSSVATCSCATWIIKDETVRLVGSVQLAKTEASATTLWWEVRA